MAYYNFAQIGISPSEVDALDSSTAIEILMAAKIVQEKETKELERKARMAGK